MPDEAYALGVVKATVVVPLDFSFLSSWFRIHSSEPSSPSEERLTVRNSFF
jgi:hypothetical protein